LARYLARPAIANMRIAIDRGGYVVLKLKTP
jgi:hypothetical protein